MNNKFKNYPIIVFCNDIDFGVNPYGVKQYIQDVVELDNGDFRITTDVQTFAIKSYAFGILEGRVESELNDELDNKKHYAILEDMASGFHQY